MGARLLVGVPLLLRLLRVHEVLAIPESLVVEVSGGRIQGALHEGAVRFLGIPYSRAQRFQVPATLEPRWSGTLNASTPAPQCPQTCPPVIQDLHCQHVSQMHERCLYLNIYRPAYNLPAGTSFPSCSSSTAEILSPEVAQLRCMTDPSWPGTGGVLVVTINYRLGAFGFLPIFNDYDDVIGNFGLRDQQVALRWVHSNIAFFDGDQDKVTLLGADAGCQSVGLHLASPVSNALFHAAILHSCPFTQPFRDKNESRRLVQEFASALGCPANDVSCYRRKSVNDILQAQAAVDDAISRQSPSLWMFQVWGPVIDHSLVHEPSLLGELLYVSSRGGQGVKPALLGVVQEEGATSVYRRYPLPVSSEYFHRLLEVSVRENWQELVEGAAPPYRPEVSTDARQEMVRFFDDFVFVCPARSLVNNLTTGDAMLGNVWMYRFEPQITWSPGGSSWPPGGETYCQNVTCHGLDLLYLFNPPAVPVTLRGSIQELSKVMALYWTSFARYGDPNRAPPAGPASVTSSLTRSSLVPGRQGPQQQQFSFPPFSTRTGMILPSRLHLGQASGSFLTPAGSSSSSSLKQGQSGLQTSRFGSLATPNTLGSLPLPSSFDAFRRQVLSSSLALQLQQKTSAANTTSSTPTPPAPAIDSTVYWPSYTTKETSGGQGVKATMVLTQPKVILEHSIYDTRCRPWDKLGHK
ncbi:crystal protein-like isoform X2 [Pomacea canaliculata]|uniref:crystal protein-like isoform X2 n=1 Tax=Pomacea canaliculata TaxID=400727 RepID=UPI000D72A9AD|nr:crystal protein-like isoform X2 [Pomacea canaliculata]